MLVLPREKPCARMMRPTDAPEGLTRVPSTVQEPTFSEKVAEATPEGPAAL